MLSTPFKKFAGDGNIERTTKVSLALQSKLLVTSTQYTPGFVTVKSFAVLISCHRYFANDPGVTTVCVPAHRSRSGPRFGIGFGCTVRVVVTIESQFNDVLK